MKLTEKIVNDSSLKLFAHENNLDNKVRMFDVMQNNLESKQLNLLCGSEQIAARTIPVKRLQDRKTINDKKVQTKPSFIRSEKSKETVQLRRVS